MNPTPKPSSSSRTRSGHPLSFAQAGAIIVATSMSLLADELVIESFDRNGQLVFNEIPSATRYRVEWASTPVGPSTDFGGTAGHHYGNHPIWHRNGRPGDNSRTWKQHFNDEARADLPHVRALFESREWTALVPDQNHSVVTAGFGSGQDYVGAARTTDDATVIAYVPSQKEITVDLRRIAGGEAKAWWFNPREGSAQLIGTFPTTGSQAFTPAASEDWILVLDNASLDLPPPGGSIGVRPRQTDGRSKPAATDRTTWQSNL